jgi:hypothetical protein
MAPQAKSVDAQANGHRRSRPEHQDHLRSRSQSPNQQHRSRGSSILEYEIRFARISSATQMEGGAAAEVGRRLAQGRGLPGTSQKRRNRGGI